MKDVKGKIKDMGVNMHDTYQTMESHIPAFVVTVVSAIIIMFMVCIAVFGLKVKGPEKSLVPDVVGYNLEDALIMLQVKEIYPKISLRYTDDNTPRGVVLSQDPKPNSLVKGNTRISLVVSRGPVQETVPDLVGKDVSSLNIGDELAMGKSNSIIKYAPVILKKSSEPAGKILAQNPKKGTELVKPTTVQLVVSTGKDAIKTTVPDVRGMNVSDFLNTMSNSKLIYEVSVRQALDSETPFLISSTDSNIGKDVNEYTKIPVEFLISAKNPENLSCGVFMEETKEYPFPVNMKLESINTNGEREVLTSFMHNGGAVTVPYSVDKGSILIFSVRNKEITRMNIN